MLWSLVACQSTYLIDSWWERFSASSTIFYRNLKWLHWRKNIQDIHGFIQSTECSLIYSWFTHLYPGDVWVCSLPSFVYWATGPEMRRSAGDTAPNCEARLKICDSTITNGGILGMWYPPNSDVEHPPFVNFRAGFAIGFPSLFVCLAKYCTTERR